jgi:hypothetical protein
LLSIWDKRSLMVLTDVDKLLQRVCGFRRQLGLIPDRPK